jgi:tripartite-type tricarboxylate transporter receptor subunit TctC
MDTGQAGTKGGTNRQDKKLQTFEGGKTMQRKFRIGELVFCLLFIFLVFPLMSLERLHAQNFPTKPINLIIPFGSGGNSDLTMRLLSPFAQEHLGQPLIIQIKPGASGAIGANEVAQAKPDGYTLLSAHTNCNTILPAAEGRGQGPGELAAVCRINTIAGAFWVQPNAPYKNFKEMVAWAKANPGKLVFGNTGTWSGNDMSWRWLELNAGFTSRNVPYDGAGQAMIALLGGHIHVANLGNVSALPNWRAGRIRPLVVYGSKRQPDLPGVPCLLEEGYDMKGLGGLWLGIMAPKGTPRPIIDKLAEGFKKMTEDKRAIAGLKAMGEEFGYLGSDEFDKMWQEEFLAYKDLLKIIKK